MLKKIMFLLIVASSLALAVPAAQKSRAVGGWLQLGNAGEHFGLDYKYRRTETTAIDIYGHFYFSSGDNALGVYFAHYWHNYNLLKLASDFGRIGLYAGLQVVLVGGLLIIITTVFMNMINLGLPCDLVLLAELPGKCLSH